MKPIPEKAFAEFYKIAQGLLKRNVPDVVKKLTRQKRRKMPTRTERRP